MTARATTTAGMPAHHRSRLRLRDLLLLGSTGLRARPGRTVLSALGIAIGIAAMIGVSGASASSHHQLDTELAKLGTNLLIATGSDLATPTLPLPPSAAARTERIPGVSSAATTGDLPAIGVYRNALIPLERSGGITVAAADLDLPGVVAATIRTGRWLNAATATLPATVLGSTAAERLCVTEPGRLVWMGGTEVVVVGILDPVTLAPELDTTALVGIPHAISDLGFDGNPTTLYERSTDVRVASVRDLLPSTLQPEQPAAIAVSRPSDALAAAGAADRAFSGLLLGVGFIALVVGGIGVANTMVITVLERRREIGLRRALGAKRIHIGAQFLTEAVLLSLLGGLGGIVIGTAVVAAIAAVNGWVMVVPPALLAGALAITVVVGGLAGISPAVRAARTAPTVALGS